MFLAAPLYVLWCRLFYYKERLRISDCVLILSYSMLCVVSLLYHRCDDANHTVICFIDCVLPVTQLHYADLYAAGYVVHATLTLNWEPMHVAGQVYLQLINYMFAFGVFGLYGNWDAYLYLIVSIAVVDSIMRLTAVFPTDPTTQQIISFKNINGPLTCFESYQQFLSAITPVSSLRAWFIWIPLAIGTALTAVFLQYTSYVNEPYAFDHFLWHTMGAAAGLFGTIAFLRPFSNNFKQQINGYAYKPL